MKVFISWSGELSKKVAETFNEWLPSVIQSVKPYFSPEDINKGTRWSTSIAKELQDSSFGIFCITPNNIESPWINFEAGALSKKVDESHVCPFLIKVKPSDLTDYPLSQFQLTQYNKEDIKRLMTSLNNACEMEYKLDETSFIRTFEKWYPDFEGKMDDILKTHTTSPDTKIKHKSEKSTNSSDILEELLQIARTQLKILSEPANILPKGYIASIIEVLNREQARMIRHPVYKELEMLLLRLKETLLKLNSDDLSYIEQERLKKELINISSGVLRTYEYITHRLPREIN